MFRRTPANGRIHEVWRWESKSDTTDLDPAVARILDILDPVESPRCAFCGGNKAAGPVSCIDCSRRCPDPDCHGTPRWVKEPGEELCRHCAAFVHRLDALCRGRPERCDLEVCVTGRNATGDSNPLECFGPSRERDGYFVYQLETGYIGMTYNPSRRQFEHDREERIWRNIDSRDDIENRDAYFGKAFYSGIEEDWETHYQEHWRGVRASDKSAYGERRIRWLSPSLPTRNAAYRCEWALKQYRNEANGHFPGTYDAVVSLSSVPVVVFQSAGLDYDADAGRVSFDLSWDLPGDLGPSQVIPVSHYELQRYDASSSEYVVVASDAEPGFRGRFDFDLVGKWRARAVNFDDIPGPWTDFTVSEHDVALGVQKLVRVADVSAELIDGWTGEIKVRWSADNTLPGVRYEVEGQGSDGKRTVVEVGDVTEYRGSVVVDEATSYQYSVRAVLDGVGGVWQSGGDQSRCVAGGIAPGPVISLRTECLSDGSIRVRWDAPEWFGYDAIQGYGLEIIHAGGAPEYVSVCAATSWYDTDSKMDYLSDISYRVRAWSAMGRGPWSDAATVGIDRRRHAIRSALPSALQLRVAGAGADWISFQWGFAAVDGLSYDLEINTSSEIAVTSVAEIPVTVPVVWPSALTTCRLRPTRRGVIGDWSEPIGIGSAKDYTGARKLAWPEGVNVGLVAVEGEHGSPSVVAVWSRRDDRFLAQGTPDFGVPLLGQVTARNKGGLEASWCGIRCFVPASRTMGNSGQLDTMVGKFIGLQVLESNLRRHRLIRRAYIERRELVCAEIPLGSLPRQSAGVPGRGSTKASSAVVPRRMVAGSTVTHRTLGQGTVLWLGDRSAQVEFSNARDLGVVLCRVRDLIIGDVVPALCNV